MAANPNRSKRTNELYRYEAKRYLGDWLPRPLDAVTRKDVETRFNSITADHGWSAANRAISLLRSVYRRPCVDLDGLRNPVDLWLAGGGKFHRKTRRKISAPAEVLPCWRAGIEAEVHNPAIRDALWFGLYTGMRREEVLTLRWERVDLAALTFRVEETKTGVPLELPIIVVTSLRPGEARCRRLYETLYCARGEMENLIKECQLDLFADRTSDRSMRANQLRLWFASMAYVLLCALRRIGLAHTRFARASCGTIRLKLLKIAALVRISVRQIKFAMASGCPYQREFQAAHDRLSAAAA